MLLSYSYRRKGEKPDVHARQVVDIPLNGGQFLAGLGLVERHDGDTAWMVAHCCENRRLAIYDRAVGPDAPTRGAGRRSARWRCVRSQPQGFLLYLSIISFIIWSGVFFDRIISCTISVDGGMMWFARR